MAFAHFWLVALAILLTSMGCVSPSAPARQDSAVSPGGRSPSRTLVMAINSEVGNLSPKAIGPTNPDRTTRIFNANLTLEDARGNMRPYLAEALPQLNTESWQVYPDGRMETTWRLRPGLTWHDGQPLTAEDFVFAFQVYKAPELRAYFGPRPQSIIDQVVAVDPRTIRISWRSSLLHLGEGLGPLPRAHLTESFAAFEADPVGQRDAFMGQHYWTVDYVGAGPFRLTNWEPASHLEGEAFEGHALGKPKIERIVIRLINNENTVLANMLAGEMHLTLAQGLQFDQAMVLRTQAGFNDVEKKGSLIFIPASLNMGLFQHRPEYLQTPGFADLRVRKAIAHAIDREAIDERLFEGYAPTAISFVYPDSPYYGEVNRVITRHPYDPRRTEQLMGEAGYTKDREGFFAGQGGQRFQPALWHSAEQLNRTAGAIVLDSWKGAGIEGQPYVMPSVLLRDPESRSTFPGFLINGIGGAETSALASLTSDQISSPANRWNGQNRSAWSNPDFDLLAERYYSTLDRAEQIHAFVQVMKLHSEQIPHYPLHYNLQVVSHVAALKGPEKSTVPFNIHEWEWQ